MLPSYLMNNCFPLNMRVIAIAAAVASSSLISVYAGTYGDSGQAGSGSLQTQTEREIVRRQEDLIVAENLLKKGDDAMKKEDYETAYNSYLDAVDLIGSGPTTSAERATALNKFSQAGVAYAEKLINSGRYSDAERVAKTILLQQYNPTYKPAIQLLSNLEQPDYYNKTVTPQFAADREEVARLLSEAEGYYSRGSYDLAKKRYEQVLNIDHYNIAARKGMEQVELAKQNYYNTAYNETRSRMLWQVSKGWELPVRKFQGGKDTFGSSNRSAGLGNEAITAKLNRIIVPKFELNDSTIREAVDFLRQISQQLDTTETDPAKKGVNIFLKLSGGNDLAAVGGGSEISALPGSEATPSESTPSVNEDTRVTLSLNNVPLYEALRYVAQLAGLKIKIDNFAVSIVPITDISTELVTKEYRVPPNFIPNEAQGSSDQGGSPFLATASPDAGPRLKGRRNAQEFLQDNGVQFPQGASAQYIASGSRLIVRNTQDNIDLIDILVDSSIGGAPTQVTIESKFVEINQNNLKELGFDWLLGPFAIGGGTYGAGGNLTGASTSDYPFVEPGQSTAIGSNSVTSGLRSGQGASPNSAVTINGLDALLAGLKSGPAPGIFSLAGVYTNPQFQMVIRALDQKKGIDLMSAPKVTTKSGSKAVINIIREFIYPTEFDPPQVPQSVGATSSGTATSIGFTSSAAITPTTPTAFETRNTGVTLDVTPVVGPDGYTIDLDLAPEVVDFDGFINYGTPILGLTSGVVGGVFGPPRSTVISPNVINQPVFSTRKVTTSVTIWDGMTVSLGGLIREDVQKIQDKVPLLGDIPLVGRLFRTDVDQKLKKNLIIFVTAQLIDAEGKPVRTSEESEEIVEPLGLPGEIPPPNFQFKAPAGK